MNIQPELGQIVFGNPTGDYGTEEWQDALVDYLLNEIERVFWNTNQKEWNRHEDPKLEGVEFRPYCWNEGSEEAELPNLKFKDNKQEIRWYKYPGRGQSYSELYNEKEWIEWLNNGLKIIRSNEKDLY